MNYINIFLTIINLIYQKIVNSKKDFKHPGISEKNKINNLSCDYYDEIISYSVQYFSEIQGFLENPRNTVFYEKYHSTADEIKSKLIQYRDNFNSFDEVLNHLYDLIIDGNQSLKHRKRLAYIFLHYMYCNCDIGKNAQADETYEIRNFYTEYFQCDPSRNVKKPNFEV